MTYRASLKNLGNTCYINAIIQCLGNLEDLDLSLDMAQVHNGKVNFTEKFLKLIEAMDTYEGVISPVSFVKQVKEMFPKYNNKQQHDAHEFLMDILDILHTEDQNSTIRINKYGHKLHKESSKAWVECVKQDSRISELIFGQIIRTYKCRDCEHTFNKYERFNTLDLHPHVSLTQSLDRYFNYNDIVYISCDNCGKPERQQEHSVVTKIIRAPKVMFILFKQKPKDNEIDIPYELDISDISLYNQDESYTYTLKNLVCHIGLSPEVGHYYNVQVNSEDTFTYYDDEKILNAGRYDKRNIYMIMYERKRYEYEM